MQSSPLSAAFAAGGDLESGCQAEYGIHALVRRRTTISSATYALGQEAACRPGTGGVLVSKGDRHRKFDSTHRCRLGGLALFSTQGCNREDCYTSSATSR